MDAYIYILDFYSDSLNLKKTSDNYKKVNYLDFSVAIEGNNLITCIYEKRNEFDFNTIKILYFSSNVHFPFCKIFISMV